MCSDHLELLMNQAKELVQAGNYEGVITVFQQALQVESSSRGQKKKVLSKYIKALRKLTNYQKLIRPFLECWLALCPTNHKTLDIYLKDVVKANKPDLDKAFEVYECWSKIEPNNSSILFSYATALIEKKQYKKASEVLDKLSNLPYKNIVALVQYAEILIKIEDYCKALEIIERAIKIDSVNHHIKLTRIKVLIKLRQEDKALESLELLFTNNPNIAENISIAYKEKLFNYICEDSLKLLKLFSQIKPKNKNLEDIFIDTLTYSSQSLIKIRYYNDVMFYLERLLEVRPDDVAALTMYAQVLAIMKNNKQAFKMFEYALQINPSDIITLNTYGNHLSYIGEYSKAFSLFQKSLKLQPNNVITLTNYANSLGLSGDYSRCFDIFDDALSLKPDDSRILSKYINFSIKSKAYKQACQLIEKLIELKPKNVNYLNQYADILEKLSRYEEAYEIFERSLKLKSSSYVAVKYAKLLEDTGKYQKAISQLREINLAQLSQYHANVIRLSLGRLYYRVKLWNKGNEYFQEAIANSDDKERTLLYSARSILSIHPHSDTAIEMLRQIPEDSPRYVQAQEILTLNLSEEEYFNEVKNMVKTDVQSGLSDTEMLNRAMYHKIANEISILKGIAYRILRRSEREDPLLSSIIQDIEDVFEEVNKRRAAQKSEIETIPDNDYGRILAVISKTAHDISDFVNNQLAVIESKTRRAMRKLTPKDEHYVQFEKLLAQLELTQTALSDLKAINEGITIKNHRFKVKALFEKWKTTSQIDNARIILHIRNGDSQFYGDEEKIKSALNELVENSLKHNADQQNLTIYLTSEDMVNPPGIRGMTIPGEQKYLVIEFADNGKGILEDNKDWIFQPLATTSQEGKGSGLGLFIIRKTLTKMNGYIRETGEDGARFEIYIPYVNGENR